MNRLTSKRKFKQGRQLKKDWNADVGADAIREASNKLAEYEDSLLEPEEVKEFVLDICKGDYKKWNEKLCQLLHDNYENAK